MTPENKQLFVNHLREAYIEFMNKVLKIPGSPMQKQQGFFRFDEGHMWMQNAILSFTAPEQSEGAIVEPVEGDQPEAQLEQPVEQPASNNECAPEAA